MRQPCFVLAIVVDHLKQLQQASAGLQLIRALPAAGAAHVLPAAHLVATHQPGRQCSSHSSSVGRSHSGGSTSSCSTSSGDWYIGSSSSCDWAGATNRQQRPGTTTARWQAQHNQRRCDQHHQQQQQQQHGHWWQQQQQQQQQWGPHIQHMSTQTSSMSARFSTSTRSSSSGGGGGKGAEGPDASQGFVKGTFSPGMFPLERIRNFCIIAHIDHGKSTLADRLMQMTGAVPAGSRPQYLDKLQVERERGITIKAQSASLVYPHSDGHTYLLNLIDTPGHVDFSYEVSRSLAACQGAVLLVDASQGVQAQTVANFYLAFEQDLALLPVLNKVDLPSADPAAATQQMVATFDIRPEEVLQVSAKTGQGLDALLPAIVERIPPPRGSPSAPLRLLLYDAFHDAYRGVICLVAVVDGQLAAGDKLAAASTGQQHEALEVGILAPEPHPTGQLLTGQVGYVIPGVKDVSACRVGDTWHLAKTPVPALPGFRPVKPMVFAGLYPASADDYEALAAAIERLNLNDTSVTVKKETSDALGAGFRCGFLGPLHLEVFLQRLQQEQAASVISTAPTVQYELDLAGGGGGGGGEEQGRLVMESVADYPRNAKVTAIHEPTVLATIITPQQYCGAVMTLAAGRRGTQLDYNFLGGSSSTSSSGGDGGGGGDSGSNVLAAAAAAADTSSSSGDGGSIAAAAAAAPAAAVVVAAGGGGDVAGDRVLLRYQLPLSELAGDFYSRLKSATQGYASFDYEEGPLRPADLTLLELLVNGKPVDALARLVPSAEAVRCGRTLAARLRDLLERQQVEVVIQAAAGGRVVARETLRALRKDVLAKCYGGDVSRKRKLLEKQKEGKRRLQKTLGGLSVPADVFPELLKP